MNVIRRSHPHEVNDRFFAHCTSHEDKWYVKSSRFENFEGVWSVKLWQGVIGDDEIQCLA